MLERARTTAWVLETQLRRVDDQKIRSFIAATGDDNEVHTNDEIARAIPRLNLNGRIAHGKLIQSMAIDLLRRKETYNSAYVPLILKESWEFNAPVYPNEDIWVRYTRSTTLRIGRPISYNLEVLVLRGGNQVTVQTGVITALAVQPSRG